MHTYPFTLCSTSVLLLRLRRFVSDLYALAIIPVQTYRYWVIELLFVFVEAVFVAPRSEELGIAT